MRGCYEIFVVMCSSSGRPEGVATGFNDLQEHETEYNLATMVENSKVMKGDPSQFELLKVLGQGSFGKVSGCPYNLAYCVQA